MSDDNTIELNRRRVLGGVVTIGAAAAAAGAGTTAYFFDDAESSGNSIEAGSLELGSISGESFNISGLVPEGDPKSTEIGPTEYTGDVSSPVLDWGIVVDGQEPLTASDLNIETASLMTGSDTGSLSEEVDYTGDNDTLDDIAGTAYTDEVTLSSGDNVRFDLTVSLQDVDNTHQGESLSFGFAFKARQSSADALDTANISATSSGGS
mgnify:CR=1 FL=1